MSQGRKCLRAGFALTFLRARLVSGPEMSQGQACLKVHGRICPGPEVSCGRKCLVAGSVWELTEEDYVEIFAISFEHLQGCGSIILSLFLISPFCKTQTMLCHRVKN